VNTAAPFTILDHPSDLGIEARGTTLAEAYQNAACGLMSLILECARVEPREIRDVTITATDHEQLLVRWLSEILYLYDGQQFASREFHISELGATTLRATLRGEPFSPDKHHTRLDVKAVTYHQIQVREDQGGATVRVFLDI
jgi:SHS2 domain-containing protein